MAARLNDLYKNEVAPALMKKFEYKSVMQIPKIDKVVINVGAGEAKENAKAIRYLAVIIAYTGVTSKAILDIGSPNP